MNHLLLCLALLFSEACAAANSSAGTYCLDIRFDLARGRLIGRAQITPARPSTFEIDLDGLQVVSAEADGSPAAWPSSDQVSWQLQVRKRLVIEYETDGSGNDDFNILPHDIRLGGNWYPAVHGFFRYQLGAVTPTGWQAVSEANAIQVRKAADGLKHAFVFPYALPHRDGITFVASDRFVVNRVRYRSIDVYTYLLKEDADRAKRFLDKIAEYLARFERQFGPYPYRRLSIVEQFGVGGHSLPTYVVLPPNDIRSDSWEDSSLGHEIAHQWLGNLVFTDWSRGNWNEGMTIYMADYLTAETSNAGWECRRRMLLRYGNNIHSDNNFPLASFIGKETATDKFIGYGKSGMVFHMLRRELGDRQFFAGVRMFVKKDRFRAASWSDIRSAFEGVAGRPLGWFFRQWTQESALPSFEVESAKARKLPLRSVVETVIRQSVPAFRLRMPVTWTFADGHVAHEIVTLTGTRTTVRRSFTDPPVQITLDEAFDLFRTLQPSEYPPTIERLLTRESIGFVVSPTLPDYYDPVINDLEGLGERVVRMNVRDPPRSTVIRPIDAPRPEATGHWRRFAEDSGSDVRQRVESLVLLGRSPMAARLIPDVPSTGDFQFVVRQHPADQSRYVGLIDAQDAAAVAVARELLPNLWCYSKVVIRNGKVVERTVLDSQRGIKAAIELLE